MIYIVSGYMRTGTSALMQALIAGGMDAAYSESRNVIAYNHSDSNYHPNHSGLYEIPISEYQHPNFPLAYKGKLIKVMSWGLDGLAVNPEGYRVVLTIRDTEEIRQSYEAFFSRPLKHIWFTEYSKRMNRAENMLCNRKDVLSVTKLHYREVVNNPIQSFDTLYNIGWPIKACKAASIIDPEQCRFRRELLVEGI